MKIYESSKLRLKDFGHNTSKVTQYNKSLPVEQHVSLTSGQMLDGNRRYRCVVKRVPVIVTVGVTPRDTGVMASARRPRVTYHRAQGVSTYS